MRLKMASFDVRFRKNDNVNQSYKKAFESFKKAVSLDSANEHALYNIGCMFYGGQYVKANKDSAKLYFQKAEKYGNEAAAIPLENDFFFFAFCGSSLHQSQSTQEF